MKQAYQWNAYLAEALGTFLFFFIGIGAGYAVAGFVDPGEGAASAIIVAFAHGLTLMVMVSALGAVSGGHFNPAVTFGLWVAGKIDTVKGAGYVVAQLVGGFVAAALAWYVFSGFAGIESSMAVPALNENVNMLQGIVVEAAATMVLLVAVFGTAIDGRGPKIGGIAIGLAVTAGILMAGGLTGGALNPARWLDPALFAMQWDNALVWIIGPLLGAGIVAVAYRFLFLPEADQAAAE
ncbi:MAG: aquaporin [Planctomycetota bacterium]|nr:MAG: aquaporin [Planctomycetota bacterium]